MVSVISLPRRRTDRDPPPWVVVFCFGEKTAASVDVFGVFRCDQCGRRVAVAW